MYDLLFRLVLRRIPAELAHTLGFALIRLVAGPTMLDGLWSRLRGHRDPALRTRILGIDLPGPLGLAAGFDKNAHGARALTRLGFDFVEVGTVTARPQPGNPHPRLFRLPADRALFNRMGFNNSGAVVVRGRLLRLRDGSDRVVVGVNIGRSKAAAPAETVADYVLSALLLAPVADYLVVNVSSPNTPGLRDLQQVETLEPLLLAVRAAISRADPQRRPPLLVKITADLAGDDVDAVADMAVRIGLDGVVATNTTTSRQGLRTPLDVLDAMGPGGVSGAPLAASALATVRRLRKRMGPRMTIVSVGGIETGRDAYDRIRAGASLVQSYTGFVYGGARWPVRVHRELAALLRADGFTSLADAVGADFPH